jgi:hypothetical protein
MSGFYDMLKILGNPKHPENKDMKTWVGRKFDQAEFRIDSVNNKLKKIRSVIKEFYNAWYE